MPRQIIGPFSGSSSLAEQEHARDEHEHREEIGGLAEQQERDVGEPGAGGAHAIRSRRCRRRRR